MKLAVICPVYNEEILLPHYLDWYTSQADVVFVIDNESTDRTMEIARRYSKVALSRYSSGGVFKDTALSKAYDDTRAGCVGKYDYIVLADCDEFVVSKAGRTIKEEILASGSPEVLWMHGFNMWTRPEEPSYDPSVSLFRQRTWGVEDLDKTSKPAILRPRSRGKHGIGRHEFIVPPAPGPPRALSSPQGAWPKSSKAKPEKSLLYMLHYLGLSEDFYVARRMSRTLRFSEENRKSGHSLHYCDRTEESYREEFRSNAANPRATRIMIPNISSETS